MEPFLVALECDEPLLARFELRLGLAQRGGDRARLLQGVCVLALEACQHPFPLGELVRQAGAVLCSLLQTTLAFVDVPAEQLLLALERRNAVLAGVEPGLGLAQRRRSPAGLLPGVRVLAVQECQRLIALGELPGEVRCLGSQLREFLAEARYVGRDQGEARVALGEPSELHLDDRSARPEPLREHWLPIGSPLPDLKPAGRLGSVRRCSTT